MSGVPGQLRVERAATFRARLVGLLGNGKIGADRALWLQPCRAVHTFGMRFPIDVVFIDRHGRIARIDECVQPWRLRMCGSAIAVVELAAGTARTLQLTEGAFWRA